MRFILIIVSALIILVPWIFELITFAIYLSGSQIFFVFSAARLPFSIGIEVYFGYLLGKNGMRRVAPYALSSITLVGGLVLLLYQLCDPRDCYYTGPDKFGEARLYAVLLTALITGIIVGRLTTRSTDWRKDTPATELSPSFRWLTAAIPIFLGAFLTSIVYNVPTEPTAKIAEYLCYVTVPFVIVGAVLSLLHKVGYTTVLVICILAQTALFILFGISSFAGQANSLLNAALMLAIAVLASAASGIVGYKIATVIRHGLSSTTNQKSREQFLRNERFLGALLAILFIAFGLSFEHPFVPAIVNQFPSGENLSGSFFGDLSFLWPSQPTVYYSGAYDTDHYFSSKRIEVTIVIQNDTTKQTKSGDFVLAGIGAQSPNCCKDGLDYGYRADLLVKDGTKYVVARAWETCDQNMACSGFPWQSTMHFTETPIAAIDPSSGLSIAMEWMMKQDYARSVHWYYHGSQSQNWTEYSSFSAPRIENPGFNLGVIWVANPFTNFPSNNANFFQEGVSTGNNSFPNGTSVSFQCPAYFQGGTKHCFSQMAAIEGYDSHWKVWWQWGLPSTHSKIQVNNSNKTVKISS